MFQGNYTEINGKFLIPLVRLRLNSLDNSSVTIELDGILDTGADCTLVPFSAIAKLQPKSLLRGRQNQVIYGIGKSKIIIVPYRILREGAVFINKRILLLGKNTPHPPHLQHLPPPLKREI